MLPPFAPAPALRLFAAFEVAVVALGCSLGRRDGGLLGARSPTEARFAAGGGEADALRAGPADSLRFGAIAGGERRALRPISTPCGQFDGLAMKRLNTRDYPGRFEPPSCLHALAVSYLTPRASGFVAGPLWEGEETGGRAGSKRTGDYLGLRACEGPASPTRKLLLNSRDYTCVIGGRLRKYSSVTLYGPTRFNNENAHEKPFACQRKNCKLL